MPQHEKLNYVEFGTPDIRATKRFSSKPLSGASLITALSTAHLQVKV